MSPNTVTTGNGWFGMINYSLITCIQFIPGFLSFYGAKYEKYVHCVLVRVYTYECIYT